MDKVINRPNAFVLPRGAILPEGSPIRAIAVTNIREVCSALAHHTDQVPVALAFGDLDLLSTLIKHQDQVPWVPSALIGAPSGEYDILFDQITFPLDKVSYDILERELRGKREKPTDRAARDVVESIDDASILRRSSKASNQFGPSPSDTDEDAD